MSLNHDARGFVDGVVSYLASEGKATDVTRVKSLLTRVSSQARKEKVAHVRSSVALSQVQKQRIEQLLTRSVGHSVEIDYTVDSDLIGGVYIQVADWIIDTTLSGQLQEMVKTLQKE